MCIVKESVKQTPILPVSQILGLSIHGIQVAIPFWKLGLLFSKDYHINYQNHHLLIGKSTI